MTKDLGVEEVGKGEKPRGRGGNEMEKRLRIREVRRLGKMTGPGGKNLERLRDPGGER